MNTQNPSAIVAESPMGKLQILIIGICVLVNVIDGFDVLSISFASPGISNEFSIERGGYLGTILAAELFGMAIGSLTLGVLADKYGRRAIMLVSSLIATLGMFAAYKTETTTTLLIVRVITGIGIGGLIPATIAIASEYSNDRNRALSIMLVGAGFPLGGVVGGIAIKLLGFDLIEQWRFIFYYGAFGTAAVFVLILLCVPESVDFINQKRPSNALERINKNLRRMGHSAISSLPTLTKNQDVNQKLSALFSDRDLAIKTLLLIAIFFAHIITFYFIMKWTPKLVADMNLDVSPADVLMWANVGGILGAITIGMLSRKFNFWLLLSLCLIGSCVFVALFGQGHQSVVGIKLIAATAVFFCFSAASLIYALMVKIFPPLFRAGGTGLVVSTGRGGAVLAPIAGGLLLGLNFGFGVVSLIMACGSLIAFVLVLALKHRTESAN